MIRRDYFIRMIQELTQALARILFLKKAQQYPQALDEIDRVLMKFWNLTPEQIKSFELDDWIELCRQEQGPMGEKLAALADLFREQRDLYSAENNLQESERSAAISLGLYLEAVTSPEMVVSMDLLAKIQELIETQGLRLPAAVLKRLLSYYEIRGMLDKAEDALFDWLDTSDPNAPEGGLAFYERLSAKPDQELQRGGLSRDEIEEGRNELLSKARSGPA